MKPLDAKHTQRIRSNRLRSSGFSIGLGLLSFFFYMAGCSSAPAQGKAEEARLQISPSEIKEGGVLFVTLDAPVGEKRKPVAHFEDKDIPFFKIGDASSSQWGALIGIPHEHVLGEASIGFRWEGDPEGVYQSTADFKILSGEYPSESLSVDPRKVSPRKKDLIRIAREQAEVGAIYRKIRAEKLWSGPFVMPIDSAITSRYGTKRVFNGKMKSFHNGLDLRASVGTPIYAPAEGVVVLAKNLFFTGGTVILDHGFGFFTLYAHMSAVQVKVGERVRSKQKLGLAGATGRVSGPHLHWGFVLHQTKVDPSQALQVIR